jgi:16S rRNA U1498 N3-methylase RsmE
LIDIVVTDENLHAVFLSIVRPGPRLWTVPVPMAIVVGISRGRQNTDRHNTEMGASQIITIS